MLKAEWIADDDLEPYIEPVTIKFDHLIRPCRRGERVHRPGTRQSLQVRGTGSNCDRSKAAQQLGLYARGQRPDRTPGGVERIVGDRQTQLAALLQESLMQTTSIRAA
ncbi:hypothetical protein ACFFYR_40305 [Paraburkholderia dipogonis]|uniref:hypothetical protein n=1 Tax=Paraburkholderia dipogonis TaxID=1211383 RepID=UPI0035EF85DA